LAVNYIPQTAGVLEFNFTGSDQVALTNDHLYAFEIDGVLNSQPLSWEGTAYLSNAGGAAYRDRNWINGNGNQQAFSLAVYATALENTNTINTTNSPNGIIFYAFSPPINGINQDGANLAADLALDGDLLCGTALNGGSQGNGTAFCMTENGSNFSAFRPFGNAPDEGNSQGNLTVLGNGFFRNEPGRWK
jgi:hypothetical protein